MTNFDIDIQIDVDIDMDMIDMIYSHGGFLDKMYKDYSDIDRQDVVV